MYTFVRPFLDALSGRRASLRVLGAFFLALTLAVPATTASASDGRLNPAAPAGFWDGTHREGDWIVFDKENYPLSVSSLSELQGSLAPDGTCIPPRTAPLHLAPSQMAVEEREVAVNLATCTYRFERGTPPVLRAQTAADLGAGPLATTHAHGHMQSWFSEPAQQEINHLASGVDWYYTTPSACITSAHADYNHGGLGLTGWYDVSGDFYFDQAVTCSYVEGYNTDHWQNRTFCFGQETNTWYTFSYAMGSNDGSLTGDSSGYASGGCYGGLIWHHALYRDS